MREPAKLSGSVAACPATLSNSVPGVFDGLAPCRSKTSAQKRNVLSSAPTLALNVSEPELLMNETGAVKPVSDANSVTVIGAPSVFSIFDDDNCNSLCAPKLDCAKVSCTNAPPIVWSIVNKLLAPPETSHDNSPSKQVNVDAPTPMLNCSLASAAPIVSAKAAAPTHNRLSMMTCPSVWCRATPPNPILHINRQDVSCVAMPFTTQEKAGLSHILQTLLDADEPEAMLTLLRHVAERKAFGVARGLIDRNAAQRWTALADALRAAEASLKTAA